MGGEEAGFHPDAAKGSGMLQKIKPSLSCTDSIKQVSLFHSKAKGRSKASGLAGFSSNRAPRNKCAKKLWFCRLRVFLLSARLICSVVLLLCVFCSTEDSSMLPLKQGKGKLQKTVLQWDTCICTRNKTTLAPEKEKRAMTVCRQEGSKVGNKLTTAFSTSAETISS